MKQERLIYLATILTLPELPKVLQRYVPLYDVIQGIQNYGIVGVSANIESVPDQLMGMVRKGKQAGDTGTVAEYKAIIADMVYHGVSTSNLTGKEKVELYAVLDQWVKAQHTSLVEKKVSSFDKSLEVTEEQDFIFNTGFTPIDTLCDGLPSNSFVLFLAHTGAGKTSIMLSLANDLAYNYRVVYVTYEMSDNAVRYRAKHMPNLCTKDVLLSGNVTLEEIEQYADEDTIIIVDYLSLVPYPAMELRHKLSGIAAELLRISTKCKAVISAQQAKRGYPLSLESGSESFAVSHYAALVCGISKEGNDYNFPGYTTVEIETFKNRYGKAGNKVVFPFNYATLQYEQVSVSGDSRIDYDADW
jgi:hypothetical protein